MTEAISLTSRQVNKIVQAINGLTKAVTDSTADAGKWASIQNETTKAGFNAVVEALAKLQPPTPGPSPRRYSIMSDYAIPDNTPDGRVTFRLSATDEEGQPITDPAQFAKLVFEAVSSNEDAFTITLDVDQPDPMNRVGGYHVGKPGQAAVTSNLKKANGDLIGTGTDGFTVTVGEIALGSVKAEFEGLTPIG